MLLLLFPPLPPPPPPPPCSSKELDNQYSWALAALLNSSTGARGLTSLSLVNQPLGDVAITSICRGAAYSSCLAALSLKGSSVGDQVRAAGVVMHNGDRTHVHGQSYVHLPRGSVGDPDLG
jgi:hypothetical protein